MMVIGKMEKLKGIKQLLTQMGEIMGEMAK